MAAVRSTTYGWRSAPGWRSPRTIEDELAEIPEDDPRYPAYVYDWLTYLQETLVGAP